MALKLKLDEKGFAVVQDGKPVYIDEVDGKEVSVDVNQMRVKIAELNEESKQRRIALQTAEEKLSKFGDATPEDVEQFLETIEGLGGLEGIEELKNKSNVDVEALKRSMQDAYDSKLRGVQGSFESKLKEKDDQITSRDGQIYKLMVGSQFGTSKFVNENLILPPDIAEATFGRHFKVENNQVVAYVDDNRILSREKPGEPASFDEAMAVLVEKYPMKDRILKAKGATGSGSQQTRAGAKSHEALLSLPPTERLTKAREAGLKS